MRHRCSVGLALALALLLVATSGAARSAGTPSTHGSSGSHLNSNGRSLAQKPHRYTVISVIGERNSGTNFVRKLLENNLDPSIQVLEKFTQHKHYMQNPPPAPRPYNLVIVCARNAYDWILSLQYKCYCCNMREREDFWKFVAVPYVATEYAPGDPLCPNEDLDISNGNQRFKNLLDMRVKKLKNMLGLTKYAGGVDLVRLEDVLTREASLAWLQQYVLKYGLKLRPHPNPTTPCGPGGAGNCSQRHQRHQHALPLRPIEGDARPWHANKSTNARSRTAASVYLNRDKLNIPGAPYYQHRDKISIINAMIDEPFERSIGYWPMVVTYPPAEYQSPQRQRQRRYGRQA